MKKYVGAMVRKPFQLVIAAEIDHFENKNRLAKKNTPFRLKQQHLKKTIHIRDLKTVFSECTKQIVLLLN